MSLITVTRTLIGIVLKPFLAAIFGLVIGADDALQCHEADRRRSENAIRRQASLDLSRRGMVPTETAIAKWRAERMQQGTETGGASS